MAANRVHYLDGLRGWAALAVVVGHLEFWLAPSAEARGYNFLPDLFHTSPIGLLSFVAVPLFFVLSGFALSYPVLMSANASRTLATMAAVRYFRLTIPVIASCALAYALWRLSAYWNQDAGALTGSRWFAQWYGFARDIPVQEQLASLWKFALYDVYFNYPSGWDSWNPVLWTMSIELIGSFALFALLFTVRWRSLRILIAVVAAFYLAPGNFFGFAFGYLLAELVVGSRPEPGERAAVAFLVAGLVLGTFFISPYVPNGYKSVLPLALALNISTALLFVGVLFSPCLRSLLSGRLSQFLGGISFPLYLIHFPLLCSVASMLLIWLAMAALPPGWTVVIVALVTVPICIAGAAVFRRVVEDFVLTRVKSRLKAVVDRLFAMSTIKPAGAAAMNAE